MTETTPPAALPDARAETLEPAVRSTLPGLPPAWTWAKLARAKAQAVRRRSLRATLAGPAFQRFVKRPKGPAATSVLLDPFPGSVDQANALFQGRYRFAGVTIIAPNQTPWDLQGAGAGWLEALHSFTWLRDFRAADGDAARRQVRALVEGWLQRWGRYDPAVWRPDLAAIRVVSWASHLDLILSGAEAGLQRAVLDSLSRQLSWLLANAPLADPGLKAITITIGTIFGLVALGRRGRSLERAIKRLDRLLDAQILPDGGHVSRSPAAPLVLLARLVHLREALNGAEIEFGDGVIQAIDRLAPVVRFFRLGDGRLATFHGAEPGDAAWIDRVLTLAVPKGKAPARCPHLGFERIVARKTIVLMDVGTAPPPGYVEDYHAAPLAFEVSVGRERLVVSCGAGRSMSPEWQRVARATAAHSTLVLDEQNAVALVPDKDLGRRPLLPAPVTTSNRNEAGGQVWVEASHSGYVKRLDAVHRRHLWLAADGDDLRGEERIEPRSRAMGRSLPFALRFHLGPDARAALAGDGMAALIRLPGGDGWRLRVDGGQLGLEESISLAEPGPPRRAEQLVVTGTLQGGRVLLRWALTRVELKS